MEYLLGEWDMEFDYLHGEVPFQLESRFGIVVRRAQGILGPHGDSRNVVRRLVGLSAINAFEELDSLLEQAWHECHDCGLDFRDRAQLLFVFAQVNSEYQPGSEGEYDWSDYLALLALACFGEAMVRHHEHWEYYQEFDPDIETPSTIDEELLVEAWIALGFADQIILERKLRDEYQSERSKSGRKGGASKNRRINQLKVKMMEYFDRDLRHKKFSNRKSAGLLEKAFAEEITSIMRNSDPVQQIARWIGDHKKASAQAGA